MKKIIFQLSRLVSLAVIVIVIHSCDGITGTENKIADLSLKESNPAEALTVGWYLPLDYLQKIVGPDFIVGKSSNSLEL